MREFASLIWLRKIVGLIAEKVKVFIQSFSGDEDCSSLLYPFIGVNSNKITSYVIRGLIQVVCRWDLGSL